MAYAKKLSGTIAIVTGGAGFIGSNFILRWLEKFDEDILNIDNLSYAADLNNLKDIEHNLNYSFKKLNIQNQNEITTLILESKPRAILNFAAESHVDRSIEGPENFINSNQPPLNFSLYLSVIKHKNL